MTEKISTRVPFEKLQKDLEKFRLRALALGATDAKIITSDMVLIDERVRAKCINPKCNMYGTNAGCPPRTVDLAFARKVVANFHVGILTLLSVPPEVITAKDEEAKKKRNLNQLKNYEIVSRIEAEAFYAGYYLAIGFASGSCKMVFCADVPCSVLTSGKGCTHPFRARSSMESWGMDAFHMAACAGWDIYPVGHITKASDVACGARMGLVLIY